MSKRSDPSVNTQLQETSAAAVFEELKEWDVGRGCLLFPGVPLRVPIPLQSCEGGGDMEELWLGSPQAIAEPPCRWDRQCTPCPALLGGCGQRGSVPGSPSPQPAHRENNIAELALGFSPVCINPTKPGGVGV